MVVCSIVFVDVDVCFCLGWVDIFYYWLYNVFGG